MNLTRTAFAILALGILHVSAGDLPGDVQAKFIKILAASAGSAGRVGCTDPGLAGDLARTGVQADPGAKVVWAASLNELKALHGAGKMVICGKLEWLPSGGAIAIVEEGGRPQIYLNLGNISASGAVLSDAVLKIGKKL